MRHIPTLWTLAGLASLSGACPCPRRTAPPPARCVVDPSPTSYLLHLDEPARTEERIVVARVGLAVGTALRTSLLLVRAQPKDFEWKGHLRPVDLVHFAGQRLLREIPAGAPIRRGDLEGNGGQASAARLLPPGARALTLRVDWVGGSGTWVRSGDHVDIGLVRRGGGAARDSLLLLMQDARVLMAAPSPKPGAAVRANLWVSVLALPREAHGLALAQRMGRIVLFPRGAQGGRSAVYPPVTLKELESPAFWQQLQRERQRTIQPRQAPDDPGIQIK